MGWKAVILLTSMILMIGFSKQVQAGTLSESPLHIRTDFEDGGKAALDWGLSFEGLTWTIHGDYPDKDYRTRLEFYRPLAKGWDGEIWGSIKKEGNYRYEDYGFRTQLDFKGFYTSVQWTDHYREPLANATRGRYDGEDGQWRIAWKHGEHRINLSLSRATKDYEVGDGDACRDEVQAGWQWTRKKHRLDIQWQEWIGDYPQDSFDNLAGEKITFKWRLLGDSGRLYEIKGEWKEEVYGDGETLTQYRADYHTTQPWLGGALRWGFVWVEQNEMIDFLERNEEKQNWRGDFRWRKTLGHRRSWWIGGEVDLSQTENPEWTLKTQWDWPIRSVGVRLQITADYKDGGWEAGAYAQMTYYF